MSSFEGEPEVDDTPENGTRRIESGATSSVEGSTTAIRLFRNEILSDLDEKLGWEVGQLEGQRCQDRQRSCKVKATYHGGMRIHEIYQERCVVC
jgi:hypothetical protein